MSLPIKKENSFTLSEISESVKVLTNLTKQHFVGKDADLLQILLKELSFNNTNDFFETFFLLINNKIDFNSLNNTNIEQLDLIAIAKEIGEAIEYKGSVNLNESDIVNFENTLKNFSHSALHNVAFPLMILENPNVAVSAKNLLKRTLNTIQNTENIDLSEVYDELDIENLPTEFSMDLFVKLGANIQGLNNNEVIEHSNSEAITIGIAEPKIIYCELSIEQTIFLTYCLKEEYMSIKNWKTLYHLLKSNGKKYDNVIVSSNKIGLVLSVLSELYEKKTITDERYLHTNKGNGLWPFFQEYLIDSKTDQLFSTQLRKINRKQYEDDAKKIVAQIFDPSNQNEIIKRAKEIIKKEKL